MAEKYLNDASLSYFLEKLDTKYDNKYVDKTSLGQQIILLEDNGSTTDGTWLAKTNQISAYADGQIFLYKVVVAGSTTTKLNITGSGGTALGAKTIYRYGTTKLTTQYGIGQYILLMYNSLNTSFRVVNDYDNDTNTKVRQYQAGTAARTGTQYSILARYALTDKAGTYDANYSRYHTDTYIDTSNGYLYAPKLYSGGNEVAVANDIPTISVSSTGTATDEVSYITINGTEKKLASGSSVTFVDWS